MLAVGRRVAENICPEYSHAHQFAIAARSHCLIATGGVEGVGSILADPQGNPVLANLEKQECPFHGWETSGCREDNSQILASSGAICEEGMEVPYEEGGSRKNHTQ